MSRKLTKKIDRFIEKTCGCDIDDGQQIVVMNEFSEAFIGVTNTSPVRSIYDTDKVIEILVKENKMSEEDAWEHYYFNIEGAYVGVNTPVFIQSFKQKESRARRNNKNIHRRQRRRG